MKHLFLALITTLFIAACGGGNGGGGNGGGDNPDGGNWQDDKEIDKDQA